MNNFIAQEIKSLRQRITEEAILIDRAEQQIRESQQIIKEIHSLIDKITASP